MGLSIAFSLTMASCLETATKFLSSVGPPDPSITPVSPTSAGVYPVAKPTALPTNEAAPLNSLTPAPFPSNNSDGVGMTIWPAT